MPRWQEDKRVAAFVTDNAANQKKAFRATEGSGWTWSGCACHNVNLVVKNALDVRTAENHDLKRLAVQIATAKSLVSLVRRKGLDYQLNKTLKQECETRWNSLLAMIRSVIDSLEEMRVHPAFGSPEVVELIDSLNPTIMRRLVAVLTPLEIATEKLSGQNYPTLHLVAPTNERLRRELELETGDDSITRTMKKRLSRLLEEKFAVREQHIVATMLWPPFRRLEQFRATISAAQREQAVEDLTAAAADQEAEPACATISSDEDEPQPVLEPSTSNRTQASTSSAVSAMISA